MPFEDSIFDTLSVMKQAGRDCWRRKAKTFKQCYLFMEGIKLVLETLDNGGLIVKLIPLVLLIGLRLFLDGSQFLLILNDFLDFLFCCFGFLRRKIVLIFNAYKMNLGHSTYHLKSVHEGFHLCYFSKTLMHFSLQCCSLHHCQMSLGSSVV